MQNENMQFVFWSQGFTGNKGFGIDWLCNYVLISSYTVPRKGRGEKSWYWFNCDLYKLLFTYPHF